MLIYSLYCSIFSPSVSGKGGDGSIIVAPVGPVAPTDNYLQGLRLRAATDADGKMIRAANPAKVLRELAKQRVIVSYSTNPPPSQGQCGSCWAQTAVSSFEVQLKKAQRYKGEARGKGEAPAPTVCYGCTTLFG